VGEVQLEWTERMSDHGQLPIQKGIKSSLPRLNLNCIKEGEETTEGGKVGCSEKKNF
jgi:hypothetical protein